MPYNFNFVNSKVNVFINYIVDTSFGTINPKLI